VDTYDLDGLKAIFKNHEIFDTDCHEGHINDKSNNDRVEKCSTMKECFDLDTN
jgi:hypothetical protein